MRVIYLCLLTIILALVSPPSAHAQQITQLFGQAIPVYQNGQMIGRWSESEFPPLPIDARVSGGLVYFNVGGAEYAVRRMSVDLDQDGPVIPCEAHAGQARTTITGTSGFGGCD